jgi:hypothetical protein
VHNLIRVARAVDANAGDLARLIRLARPDLARMLPPERERWTEASLRSLRGLASELRMRGTRDAVRLTVELLYASLEPDRMAFALERRANGTMKMSVALGGHACAEIFDAGDAASRHDELRAVYAPIRVRERVVGAVGVACGRQRELGPRSTLFLETVAAILEVRLSDRAVTKSK